MKEVPGKIFDEYNSQISFEELKENVENLERKTKLNYVDYIYTEHNIMNHDYLKSLWKDNEGYSFSSTEFS